MALLASIIGAAASTMRRHERLESRGETTPPVARGAFESGDGEEGGVVREPMAWGCSADVSAVASTLRDHAATLTPIPPPALNQDVAELKIGRAFPVMAPHNLAILPEQLANVEQEFCKRDDELLCPSGAERARLVADILQRTARIASRSAVGSSERKAAERVGDELRHGRLPVIQFNTSMRSGPTAGIIRFQDARTSKWILGIAFAKDFLAAGENSLFLDGVIVQEMVHYDDLSFLPDPLRCYESNIEIRGHYAMIRYWMQQRRDNVKLHPRIGMVMRAGLDASSRRAKWYRYLNQVEKTDFLIEDELVSLEFQSLAALTLDRADDQRFVGELTKIVGLALSKATYVRSHVARLSSDTINANARVISAVSRLMPRVLKRYDRARGDIKEADGTTRRAAMSAEVADIQRSLGALDKLIGVLAADPDFRRKSEFVGPD
ncbi:MAG: hypothetical protein ABJF01_17405 [bacterium]